MPKRWAKHFVRPTTSNGHRESDRNRGSQTGGSSHGVPRAGESTRARDGTSMIGWRWWKLTKSCRLQSVTARTIWDGPSLVAGVTPTKDGQSGIYALAEREAIGVHRPEGNAVFGEVELSGKVVRGEHGFRAERATIRSLHIKQRAFERLRKDGFRHMSRSPIVNPKAARGTASIPLRVSSLPPGRISPWSEVPENRRKGRTNERPHRSPETLRPAKWMPR